MNTTKLNKAIDESGFTRAEIAKELGISKSTFVRKMRTQSFGIVEAEVMIELLSIEDPYEVFFGK